MKENGPQPKQYTAPAGTSPNVHPLLDDILKVPAQGPLLRSEDRLSFSDPSKKSKARFLVYNHYFELNQVGIQVGSND